MHSSSASPKAATHSAQPRIGERASGFALSSVATLHAVQWHACEPRKQRVVA